ncbi:MAG: DUF6716 putative glycosyltransferase [Candidatus Marinimicrobia bacterium]|nr:DUF6716 putative glycosyltransferase [Candidatus Neomarinimicrobiota bacterium]
MSRFLFILQFDSFIKTLMPVIEELQADHQVDLFLLQRFKKKNWIDANIKGIIGTHRFETGAFRALYQKVLSGYDVIVIGSVGARLIVNLRNFLTRHGLSTRLVSGYVGALLKNYPTGFYKGVMRRSFTDLIWTPGTESRIRILNTGLINTDRTTIVPTGLPRFDSLYAKSKTWRRKPETILYIEQPTFPKSRSERLQLVQQLANVAHAYPEREVVIKPRFGTKTGHAHPPKHLLPDLIEEMGDCPSNLSVSKDDLYTEFQRTDFALSISSTGALEAMLIGIPTYFIRDFCGETNLYGSSDFNISGNVVDFETVINRKLPDVDFKKAESIMRFDGQNTRRLTDSILSLANMPPRWIRSKTVRLHVQYSTDPFFEPIRQNLKHTHERNPELIALWMNQSIQQVGPASKRDLVLDFWNGKDLQMDDDCNSAITSNPVDTTDTSMIRIHGFFVLGTLLSLFPQKHTEEGCLEMWEVADFELMEKWFQHLKAWSLHNSNILLLQEYWMKQDLTSGELSFNLDSGQIAHFSTEQRTSFPNFHITPALRSHLEQIRTTHETKLDEVYRLLDKIAWHDRYFEALARNWPA